MKTLLSWIFAVAFVTIVVIADSSDAFAQRRVALVVGNATYKTDNLSLANPLNDAQDVSNALKGLGFDVITKINASSVTWTSLCRTSRGRRPSPIRRCSSMPATPCSIRAPTT